MTDDNTEAPAQAAVTEVALTTERRRFSPRLDPGWATLVAAALALIGTVVTVAFKGGSNESKVEPAVAVSSTTAGSGRVSGGTTAETAPTTSVSPTSTSESATSAPSTTAPTTTSVPPPAPIVQVVSALPSDQRAQVDSAAAGILGLSDRLPLIVDDQFANNDYAWPEFNQTYTGGIQCAWSVQKGSYDTEIHTTAGGAWCSNGLSKVAKDFVLTVEEQLRDDSNSDVSLLFRVADDDSRYDLSYNPQTQTMKLSFVDADGEQAILPATYMAEIHRTGSNKLTLLTLGPAIAVYMNDSLVAMVSNETRLVDGGRILVRLQLNEPNEDEVLSLTRFELRGN